MFCYDKAMVNLPEGEDLKKKNLSVIVFTIYINVNLLIWYVSTFSSLSKDQIPSKPEITHSNINLLWHSLLKRV